MSRLPDSATDWLRSVKHVLFLLYLSVYHILQLLLYIKELLGLHPKFSFVFLYSVVLEKMNRIFLKNSEEISSTMLS